MLPSLDCQLYENSADASYIATEMDIQSKTSPNIAPLYLLVMGFSSV